MGYQLRMSSEIRDWLAGLAGPDPAAARLVGEADLAAHLAGQLASTDEQLSALRRLRPGVRAAEQALTRQSMGVQARAGRERRCRSGKRRCRPGRGGRFRGFGGPAVPPGHPGTRAGAAARRAAAGPRPDGAAPGAPGDGGIRLLFAVEPPGAPLLVAVLDSREAVQGQYDEAVAAATEALGMARDGDAAPAAECRYDLPSFLAEFFPGDAAAVEAGAAALAAASHGQALAQYRARLGLTRAEVAERMEVPADRVAGIERSGLAAAGIGELTRYIGAMGGRLEITADLGGDRIVLR